MAQKVKKFVEQCFAICTHYLYEEVNKKGCLRVCPFERKRNWISVNACLKLPKKLPNGNKSQKC